MESQSLLVPLFLLRHFVANGDFVSVPSSSGVGEVEGGIEVLVEVRFVVDSVVVVVVCFPEVSSVVLAGWCSVHADAVYGVELAEVL